MTSFFGTRRAAGVWGIAFVVLLVVSAAIVSLPTASESSDRIASFYKAHGQLIVIQQVLGAIALVPLTAFILSLRSNRWLRPALVVFAAVELVTNVVPLVILAAADRATSLTLVEDLADSALFAAIAVLVVAATLAEPVWLRAVAVLVAGTCALRAILAPLGVSALDALAPLAFVALILLLSIRVLAGAGGGRVRPAEDPA